MTEQIQVTRARKLAEVAVSFDYAGDLLGGHAIWWDVLREADGALIHAGQGLAEPIAGALQPGTPFADLVGTLDAQLVQTVLSQSTRIRELEAEVEALRLRAA